MLARSRSPAAAFGVSVALLLTGNVPAQGTVSPSFIENRGQWPAEVRFRYQQGPAIAWMHDDGLTLVLRRDGSPRRVAPERGPHAPDAEAGVALRWTFEGAAGSLRGDRRQVAQHSFFIGNDPGRWTSGAPSFARAVQHGLRPGIDLVWQRRDGRLSYDLHVAAGADASAVVVRLDGGDPLRVTADGRLLIPTGLGDVALTPPVSWEVMATGRRPVASRFELVGDRRYRIAVDRVDARLPLVVDPGLEWATFLGAAAFDAPVAMKLDDAGRIYFAGFVQNGDFPTTPGALEPTALGGTYDWIVGSLDATGTTLRWATHLGGAGNNDVAYDLEVPASGDPVTVVGLVGAVSAFPVTAGAYQPSSQGGTDAAVAQLTGGGTALAYSTLLGGSRNDRAGAIRSDGAGGYWIAGYTVSPGFPTSTTAFQPSIAGDADAFVMRFDPRLSGAAQVVRSTLLGGSGAEGVFAGGGGVYDWDGIDLWIDGGQVTVVGRTDSEDYPVTTGAYQTAFGGDADCFVSQLDSGLTMLTYSTYVGGLGEDVAYRVEQDRDGDIVFCGDTMDGSFPVTTGAYQTTFGGMDLADGTIVVLRPAGQGSQDLLYSTFVGGPGDDYVIDLLVESSGVIVACGATSGSVTATTGAWQTAFVGSSMGCALRLDPVGNGAADAHYLSHVGAGGTGSGVFEWAAEIEQRPDGHAVIVGVTDNTAFSAHVSPGAYQTTYGGGSDMFVMEFDMLPSNMTRFGAGTAACLGDIDLQVNQMPAPGATSFQLICNDAPPSAAGVLLIGTQVAAPIPVLNVDIWVLPLLSVALTSQNGFARTPIPLYSTLPTPLPAVAFQYLWLTTPSCAGSGPLAASHAVGF